MAKKHYFDVTPRFIWTVNRLYDNLLKFCKRRFTCVRIVCVVCSFAHSTYSILNAIGIAKWQHLMELPLPFRSFFFFLYSLFPLSFVMGNGINKKMNEFRGRQIHDHVHRWSANQLQDVSSWWVELVMKISICLYLIFFCIGSEWIHLEVILILTSHQSSDM